MKTKPYATVASVALWSALATAPAGAQALSASDQRETIVITGTFDLNRPTESGALGDKPVLDTPFSVTIVDAEDIAKRQPQSIAELFINDPSVFSFSSAGTVNWWGLQIRGLGVRNYFIDDAPIVTYWGGDYPLEAVETVEALKGATGFMYGFGAPGGAISYHTKRPTMEPLLSTEVGFRGQSVATGHIDAGGPIGDTGIGYRANLAGAKGKEYNESNIERGLASLAVVARLH